MFRNLTLGCTRRNKLPKRPQLQRDGTGTSWAVEFQAASETETCHLDRVVGVGAGARNDDLLFLFELAHQAFGNVELLCGDRSREEG